MESGVVSTLLSAGVGALVAVGSAWVADIRKWRHEQSTRFNRVLKNYDFATPSSVG
jgi:hypothetical protein